MSFMASYPDARVELMHGLGSNLPGVGGQHHNGPASLWCRRVEPTGEIGEWKLIDRGWIRTILAAIEITELAETADEAIMVLTRGETP